MYLVPSGGYTKLSYGLGCRAVRCQLSVCPGRRASSASEMPQLSYGPGHRVHLVELWSWVQRDVQLSYGPGRRVFFSFQISDFRFSAHGFQKQFFRFRFSVFRDAAVELWSWASNILSF